MDKSRLELKVGLFVLVCLVLLAGMMVQFNKGASLLHDTYLIKLRTANVGGLKHEASVLLAGVQVGTVKDIQLAADGKSVTILLKINKKFPIYGDARFVIEQAGFLGDQYVAVLPTENKMDPFTNNASVTCEPPFDLQEVARSAAGFIQRLDGTAKKLDESVTDLRAKVLNAQTLASFGDSITNLRLITDQAVTAVKGVNDIIATNGMQVSVAVSNAVNFSAELNRLAISAQNVLATNGANLTAATKNIEAISVTAKQLAADLQAGKGLAGTVLQNPELATNFQALAANLAVTSSNLNRLGLWGILWSHKPPATNSTATSSTRKQP